MKMPLLPTPRCSVHGAKLKRADCPQCNSAYGRLYQRRRRHAHPDAALVERAQHRAQMRNVPFRITRKDVAVPTICPALGIPLIVGQKRAATSPSLDRIQPHLGYIPGNVRVLSDRANRLKGNQNLPQLLARAAAAMGKKRDEYQRLAHYVDRELILAEVRGKAAQGGRAGEVWAEVARFLDRAYIRADWTH